MNTRRHVLLTLLAGSAVLAGCAGPQVSDYAQQRPTLQLDRYLNGRIRAHGIFQKHPQVPGQGGAGAAGGNGEANRPALDHRRQNRPANLPPSLCRRRRRRPLQWTLEMNCCR